MRTFPTVALLVALAGCVTPPSVETPDVAAPRTLAWSLEDCVAAVAVIPVPASALQPYLPEGFTLVSPADVGLPPDPRGDAVFGLEAFDCARVVAGNETTEDAAHGGLFAFVEPPAQLADPEVDFFSFYRWDTLLGNPTMRAFFADAGAPVYDGEASVTTAAMPQAGGPLLASLAVNGTSFEFSGGSHAPADSTGGVLKEYFAVPGGYATWKTRGVAPFGQGAGTITVSGGMAEELLGADPVPGYVLFMSDLSFEDGTATVP